MRGTQKRTLEDLGTYDQGRMFKRITELKLHMMDNGATPLVVDGEDFEENPEGIMKAWSQAMGQEIRDWKDLIPPALKMGAILQLEMNGWVSPGGYGADREGAQPGGLEAAPAVP